MDVRVPLVRVGDRTMIIDLAVLGEMSKYEFDRFWEIIGISMKKAVEKRARNHDAATD